MKEMFDEYIALVIIGIVLIILALKSPFSGAVKDLVSIGLGGLIGYLGRGVVTAKKAAGGEPE